MSAIDTQTQNQGLREPQTDFKPEPQRELWREEFTVPGIILAALLLAVALGGYYYGIRDGIQQSASQPTRPTPTIQNTQRPQPSISSEEPTKSEGSFQEILARHCEEINTPSGGTADAIDLTEAPITLNQEIIKVSSPVSGKVWCMYPERDRSLPRAYIFIQQQERSEIYIYDANSDELDHDGPPFLGSIGKVIRDDGNMKITVYLLASEGPAFVGQVPVMIRGEKRLRLRNDDIAYANYSTVAINGDDTRLIAFLQPYSKPYEFEPEVRELVRFPEDKLRDQFFGDLSALQPSEEKALREIERVLGAVSAR